MTLQKLLRSIQGVSRDRPVTQLQLSEIIRGLWSKSTVQKAVIEFSSSTPEVPDYSLYEAVYGQTPNVRLYTIDQNGNRIERTEKPYFQIQNDKIIAITFGELMDGVQTGFITITR